MLFFGGEYDDLGEIQCKVGETKARSCYYFVRWVAKWRLFLAVSCIAVQEMQKIPKD